MGHTLRNTTAEKALASFAGIDAIVEARRLVAADLTEGAFGLASHGHGDRLSDRSRIHRAVIV